jgi:hypothetical protein
LSGGIVESASGLTNTHYYTFNGAFTNRASASVNFLGGNFVSATNSVVGGAFTTGTVATGSTYYVSFEAQPSSATTTTCTLSYASVTAVP